MKSVSPGNSNDETCPNCQRPVASYSYAFSATHKNVSSLQDRLSSLDAEVSDLKKSLIPVGAEADTAISRLNEWRLWGIAAKGKMSSMPPSGFPRGHVVPRSRSPRRSQVQLARLEFAPQAPRVPEYDG